MSDRTKTHMNRVSRLNEQVSRIFWYVIHNQETHDKELERVKAIYQSPEYKKLPCYWRARVDERIAIERAIIRRTLTEDRNMYGGIAFKTGTGGKIVPEGEWKNVTYIGVWWRGSNKPYSPVEETSNV